MLERIKTAIVLIAILLLSFYLGKGAYTILVFTFAFVGALEAFSIIGIKNPIEKFFLSLFSFVPTLMFFVAEEEKWFFFLKGCLIAAIFFLSFLVFRISTARHAYDLKDSVPAKLMLPNYPLIFLNLLVVVVYITDINLILMMIAVIITADSMAYFGGKTFGKNKLAPRISPGKTREGFYSAFVFSIIISVILNSYLRLFDSNYFSVAFGGVICFFSVIGDLVESLFKRTFGVKDSGSILPGHGGVLDRIDAYLICSPILLFFS